MNMFQLKCPNCSANLEVENGVDTFFCKYCGTKIVLDGQSPSVVRSKIAAKVIDKAFDSKVEQASIAASERTTIEKIRSEERKESKKHGSKTWKIALIIFGIIAALFLIITSGIVDDLGYSIRHSAYTKQEAEAKAVELDRLNNLFNEIQKDLENKDYDSALIKVTGLRYSLDTYSAEYRQWEATRTDLVNTINMLRSSTN